VASAEIVRWTAELVLDLHAGLGESPAWDAAAGELVWVDIMAGVVHRFDPARGLDRSFAVGQPVGAAVPRRGGGVVLALRDGFAVVDGDDGGSLRWLASVERDNPRTRMNDAACDSAGRLWAGSMDMEEREPLGSLYRFAPESEPVAVLDALTISNGLGWSPEGGVFYHIDSPRLGVEAFDFEPREGTLSGRRRLLSIEPGAGEPDGLTVDAEGCIWVALWGGSSVRRYRPDGQLVGVLELPVTRVTSCVFGGAELETLYVTTALPDTPAADEPHAGGVFAARPGVRGLPTQPFAG
jgi:sugar lactone lactonase YvrE